MHEHDRFKRHNTYPKGFNVGSLPFNLSRTENTLKHYSDIVSDIPSGSVYGIFILTFYLTFFLADIVTFFLTVYLASILTDFLAYILTFFLAFYLVYLRRFFVVEVRRGTL